MLLVRQHFDVQCLIDRAENRVAERADRGGDDHRPRKRGEEREDRSDGEDDRRADHERLPATDLVGQRARGEPDDQGDKKPDTPRDGDDRSGTLIVQADVVQQDVELIVAERVGPGDDEELPEQGQVVIAGASTGELEVAEQHAGAQASTRFVLVRFLGRDHCEDQSRQSHRDGEDHEALSGVGDEHCCGDGGDGRAHGESHPVDGRHGSAVFRGDPVGDDGHHGGDDGVQKEHERAPPHDERDNGGRGRETPQGKAGDDAAGDHPRDALSES